MLLTLIFLVIFYLAIDLHVCKPIVRILLSCGATRWEAAREGLSRAVAVGITPTVQAMKILGIVSIPGMMTGQILGGTVPEQAARYQMMICMFTTCVSVALFAILQLNIYCVFFQIFSSPYQVCLPW
jgi:putative ABC transport system permease protein